MSRFTVLLLLALTTLAQAVYGQAGDPAQWFDPSAPYIKVAVVEDGVHRLSLQDLEQRGLLPSGIERDRIRLFESGREVPMVYDASERALIFVGEQNRGEDEVWAYNDRPEHQSSTYYSLYSDTTHYWLTWGTKPGLRYAFRSPAPPGNVLTSFRHSIHLEEDAGYFFGATHESDAPLYTKGEGRTWRELSQNDTAPANTVVTASLEDFVAGTDAVEVRVRFIGRSGSAHRVVLEALLSTGSGPEFTPVGEVSFSGYDLATLAATVPASAVPASRTLQLRIVSYNDTAAFPNSVLLDWIEIEYDRTLVAGKALRLTAPPSTAATFELDRPPGAGYVLAPTEGVSYTLEQRITVDAGVGRVWIAPNAEVYTPVAYRPARVVSNWATYPGADYVLLTNEALYEDAVAHAAQREQQRGYTTAVVRVNDVFDQFDYGRPTPIAIRRFTHATQQWDRPAQFLALYGDALWPDRARPLTPWEVPSYGIYPSDGWFGMQTDGPDDWSEALAIGRIPLRTSEQAALFREKLVRYENAPPDDWLKRMLLIVGGTDVGEQRTLQSYADTWGSMAATGVAAMDTLQYYKNSESALDLSFQDSLRYTLRSGVSWLSYFGHSSSYSWEVVSDAPEDFNNASRLPVVLSLGCRTGTFIGDRFSDKDLMVLGEDLVLSSFNGAIAHWGSSGLASIGPSATLAHHVHAQVFEDSLRTLGTVFQRAKANYATGSPNSTMVAHLLQYGLIGDPSTQYVMPTKPDFHITPDDIATAPSEPIPADSSLTLSVRLRNRGLVPSDSLSLTVAHTRPNATRSDYRFRVPPLRRDTTATFALPIDETSVGDNRLAVHLDPDDEYAEVTEADNRAVRTQTVFSTGLFVIHPTDYARFSETAPLIRLGTTTTEANRIVFEVDTSATFDSPFAIRTEHSIQDGLVDVRPLGLGAGSAYYWRARIEAESAWVRGVFSIGDREAAFFQDAATFDDVELGPTLARTDGTWAFNTYPIAVSASSERGGGQHKGQFVVSGQAHLRLTLGFGMLIINGNDGNVRAQGAMPTYEISDGLKAYYDTDSTKARIQLEEMARTVQAGDHVLIRTRHLGVLSSATIPEHIKRVFRALGSTAIDTLDYGDGWIFYAEHGDPDSVFEYVFAPGESERVIPFTFHFPHPKGEATSIAIGPAQRWEALRWTAERPEGSDVLVSVRDVEGHELIAPTSGGSVDLSSLSAATYPTIHVHATFSDSTQRSTPQLRSWEVAFASPAETGLKGQGTEVSALVDEGEDIQVSTVVENLSPYVASDTLLVRYYTVTENNVTRLAATDTLMAIEPGSALPSAVRFPSIGLAGTNQVIIRASQQHYNERVQYNNVLVRPFEVRPDRTPPTVSVRIEGEHAPHDARPVTNLQDPAYPFVSTNPRIEATLTDSNPHRPLTDTTLVQVYLDGQRVYFSDVSLDFTPATDGEDTATISYRPQLVATDTTHTLRLQAFDAAGNEAADSPYQVHFKTQAEASVDHLFPYPNPMSTSTTFAFELKGADAGLVDTFRIRIYSLNGRLIREFDLVEEGYHLDGGELRIGWNRLRWDGRDEDGDLLATGVYLYTTTFGTEGRSHRVNGGVEKIAIIR